MKKILVAVDLSDLSEGLVRYGYEMAAMMDADIGFIHIVPHPTLWKGYEPWLPPQFGQEILEIAEKKLRRYIKSACSGDCNACIGYNPARIHVIVKEGNPATSIIDLAKDKDIDLIIMGHRGQSALEWFLVGSTATSVARYAHCSVLIYRPPMEDEEEEEPSQEN